MKKLLFLLLIFALGFMFTNCSEDEPGGEEGTDPDFTGPVDIEKTNPTKVYVHYMPWFESPATNGGNWGIHWTMGTANPENVDAEGKREIASHYYPLTGPYATSDADIIEYQLLLMKYSGVDGVLIDWYGSYDINDYKLNRDNTEALIKQLDDVGLSFAITYEDQTTTEVVNNGAATNIIEAATQDINYLANNYFNKSTYEKIDDSPLLTIFGPQAITNGTDWTTILSSITQKPKFLSLWYESGELGANASGEYSWVYQDNSHIANFYANQAANFDISMGSAYPGFHDYYAEGNWGDGMGWGIDHKNGETFQATLDMAADADTRYLQIVTWNDYGEGTMIEPTLEFEYMYLEKLQTFTGVSYSKDVLEYISTLYSLRKSLANDSNAQKKLDDAFSYLVQLDVDEAKAIIDELNQ